MGVFAILEEECIVPKATDMTFLQKLHNNHDGKHPKYAKPRIAGKGAANHHFEVAHYAGTVGYNVEGWLDKNKDPINEAVAGLFAKSSDPFVANIFKDYATECKYYSVIYSAMMKVLLTHMNAYVLRILRYSGFLWVVPSNTGIILRGLKLWYPKEKLGVTMHLSEIIKRQFGKIPYIALYFTAF